MLGRGRSDYVDLPQHPDEHDGELSQYPKFREDDKKFETTSYGLPGTGEEAEMTLLQRAAVPGVSEEYSKYSPSESASKLTPEDIGYGAAHRDFMKHAKGKDDPPDWDRSATYQTHFAPAGRSTQTQFARRHNSNRQYLRLLGKIALRWFASFVLSAMMVVAFHEYERVKVLDKSAKRWFNAISTGLYLTLGLNLAASLKGMAIILRWKLLARKGHKLEEVDLILGLSSLIKVFRYGFHVIEKRPSTSLVCFAWILFNAIGRLSVALTGLTYSYDSANAAFVSSGLVNITNWSNFSEPDSISRFQHSTPASERHTSHFYGLFSVVLGTKPVTKPGVSDPNFPLEDPIEFTDDGKWVYYFREFSPNLVNSHRSLAHKSDRSVEVSSKCKHYPVIEGQYGNSTFVVYRNGTETHRIAGLSDYGPLATTWLNPRADLPKNSKWFCGERCAAVAALQFLGPDSNPGPGSFFDCEVNISDVRNSTLDAHIIPDSTAVIAAGSIGFAGYSNGPDKWEYVRYPPESSWSTYNIASDYMSSSSNTTYVALLAGRFAIGSIAAKDLYGPTTLQDPNGSTANVGVLLKVNWSVLLLILGGILFAQLALGLITVSWANTVVCKDDSYLSTARLLRPIVERLGDSGCALTGMDIASTMPDALVYGVRTGAGERHHLDLGRDVPVMKRFPNGWYDGGIGEGENQDLSPSTPVSATASGTIRRRKKMGLRRRNRTPFSRK